MSGFDLSGIDGTNGYRINGAAAYERLGANTGAIGDVNGDGYDDILIGSSYWNSSQGVSYVLFGGTVSGTDINVNEITDAKGYKVLGVNASDGLHNGKNGGGDFNGDGFNDVLFCSHVQDDVETNGGRTYMIYGADFLESVFYKGTSGADSLTDYHDEKSYVSMQGNDWLSLYTGPDFVYLGQGDDELVYYTITSDSAIGKFVGGRGIDTLKFWYGGSDIDFRNYSNNRMKGFEKLLLGSTKYVTLSYIDILSIYWPR